MKKIYAEWIDYMGAYRLYDLENPQQTVAYEDDLEIARKHALDNGYSDLILCDWKVRIEVLALKKAVDSYCVSIMRQDDLYDALDIRREALETIEEAGTKFEISKELALFLRKKIHAALVAGGFRASVHSTTFGNKGSKRYRGR